MALSTKKYTAIHSKTGSDKTALKNEFDNVENIKFVTDLPEDSPIFSAVIYQIKEMQDELDYLRTEISSNKDNRIVIGSNTVISFGDMVTTTVKGKTTYSIVMTVVFTDPSNSKVTTKTTTLNLA